MRILHPGAPGRLFRAGRRLIDCSAFLILTPLAIASAVGLTALSWLILGRSVGGLLAGSSAGQQGSRGLLEDPFVVAFAIGAPLLLAVFLPLFAWARTGGKWGAVGLCAACLFLPILAGNLATLTDTNGVYPRAMMASDLFSGLSLAVLIVAPLLGMLGATAVLMAAALPLRDGVSYSRSEWPAFSIGLFAARHGVWRARAWLAVPTTIGAFLLFLLLIALASLVVLVAAVALDVLVSAFVPLSDAARADTMYVPTFLTAAITCLAALIQVGLDVVRRRSSPVLAWLALLIVVAGAIAVVRVGLSLVNFGDPQVLPRFDQTELIAVVLLFGGFALRGWLTRPLVKAAIRIRATSARTAKDLAGRRSEKPILFLRSFADDEQSVPSNDAGLAFAMGTPRGTVRIEEIVSRVMFARGPLLAFANPSLRSHPLGAARDIVPMDDWQAQMRAYMKGSQVIVCFLGRTESFLWEIDQIIELGLIERMVLVFSPTYLTDISLLEDAPVLARILGFDSASEEVSTMRDARALAFNPETATFDVFTSPEPDGLSYEEAIIACAILVTRAAVTAVRREPGLLPLQD